LTAAGACPITRPANLRRCFQGFFIGSDTLFARESKEGLCAIFKEAPPRKE